MDNILYDIAGNIGGELNLVDWLFYEHTVKFKSANYFSSTDVTSPCNLGNRQINIRQFRFSHPFPSNPPNLIPANISGSTVQSIFHNELILEMKASNLFV